MKFTPKEEETIRVLAKVKGLSFEKGQTDEEIEGVIMHDRYKRMKEELEKALPKKELEEDLEKEPERTPEQIRNERKAEQQNKWLKKLDEESEERNKSLIKPKKQFQYK